MKTLHNTYCKPNIEEWEKITALLKSIEKYYWRKYDNDGNCFLHDDTVYLSNGTIGDWNTRTEIPVQHFIDLIEDKIVAWRLVEDGFEVSEYGYTFKSVYVHNPDPVTKIFVDVETENDAVPFTNVKTYTDLLTLIRLL